MIDLGNGDVTMMISVTLNSTMTRDQDPTIMVHVIIAISIDKYQTTVTMIIMVGTTADQENLKEIQINRFTMTVVVVVKYNITTKHLGVVD